MAEIAKELLAKLLTVKTREEAAALLKAEGIEDAPEDKVWEQALYEPEMYQGGRVSRSQLLTSKERSIVFAGDLGEYLRNAGKNLWELVYSLDEYGFHMMNIMDYLIGNTDRHLRNWGFWVSNGDHKIGKLFPPEGRRNISFRRRPQNEGRIGRGMRG